jgi:hypothetical protein
MSMRSWIIAAILIVPCGACGGPGEAAGEAALSTGGAAGRGADPESTGDSAPVVLPRGTVSVAVVDAEGSPVADAQVGIGDQLRSTDPAGVAEFTDVAMPYLARVGVRGNLAAVFVDLRTARPVLQVSRAEEVREATLHGTLTGLSTYPTTPGARLAAVAAFAAAGPSSRGLVPEPSFSLDTRWTCARRGVLRALQYEYDPTAATGGYPIAFLMRGSEPADADAAGAVVEMSPLLQGELSGTLDLAAAAIPEELCLQLLFEDGANLQVRRVGAERGEFRYAVPTWDGASARLAWHVSYPNSAAVHLLRSVDGAGPLAVSVPLPIELDLPEADASGIGFGAQFSLVDPEPGVHAIEIESPDSPAAPRIVIYLAGTDAELPDLGDVGVVIPAGIEYRWTAWALRGIGDLDELVQAADYADLRGCGNLRPARATAFVSSAPRAFVSARD